MPQAEFSPKEVEALKQLAAREIERKKAANVAAGRSTARTDMFTETFEKMESFFDKAFSGPLFQDPFPVLEPEPEPVPKPKPSSDNFAKQILKLQGTEKVLREDNVWKANRIYELEQMLLKAQATELELRERLFEKAAPAPVSVPVSNIDLPKDLPELPWWPWDGANVYKHGNVRISTGDGEQGSDILYLTIYPDALNAPYGARDEQVAKLQAVAKFLCNAPGEILGLKAQVKMLIKDLDDVGTRV